MSARTPITESVHAPTPWTYRDVSGAGLAIYSPVYQVTGVELPQGMPDAPIVTFTLTAPQNVQVASERWVQFEPKGWSEMQEANAAFIVEAVNSHDRLVEALTAAREFLDGQIDVVDGDYGEPAPNRAMSLAQMIDEALGKGGF